MELCFIGIKASVTAALLITPFMVVGAAHAQTPAMPPDAPSDVEDIVVVEGQVLRGRTLGPVRPQLIFSEADIAAYGVSTLGELLEAITEETGSNRGRGNERPVVLLNGRRVSGFREIGSYPVEALSRVEVLAEEVALSYGFAANQRVLNFVLKDDVTILAVETEAKGPTAGGSTELDGSAQRLSVNGNTRISLDAQISDRPAITEAERTLTEVGRSAGLRTIAPDRRDWSVGGSYSRSVFGDATATLSGSVKTQRQDFILDDAGRMEERSRSDLTLGLTINSALAPTTWTFTGLFEDIADRTTLASLAPADLDRKARRTDRRLSLDGVLNMRPADLSAGPLSISAGIGLASERQSSEPFSEPLSDMPVSASKAPRDRASLSISADAPFQAPSPLPGILVLNANAEIRTLSDIGTLTTLGAGVVLDASEYLLFDYSWSREEGAPSLSDLSAPLVTLTNARVFDAVTAREVLAQTIRGGNSDLIADTRTVHQMGLQWSVFGDESLRLRTDYTESDISNETRTLTLLTPAFEAAFPERVDRDATGTLLSFDRRPVPTHSTSKRSIRTNLTLSRRIETERRRATGPRPTKRLRSGRPGRLRVSLTHDWTLRDRLVLQDGGPTLDFLDGGATSSLGGTPEHSVTIVATRWNEGVGSFVSVGYRSESEVMTGEGQLDVSDRLLVDARISYEFNYSGSLVSRFPILEETRLLVSVENLFDDPIRIGRAGFDAPVALQPDLLDPFGRVVRVELRKRF